MAAEETGPLRVLAIAAHPDDVDFNAAGTVAKWVREGMEVTYLLVTSGDVGGFGSVPRDQIVSTRRKEQIEAARSLGVEDVRFLEGYGDGDVEVTPALVRDLTRAIRQVRPHRVLSLSPERDWFRVHQGHPDHLATGEATARAVYPAARNPFAFPELISDEGLDAWTVQELWLMAHPNPNHGEDVTEVFDVKIRALQHHASQLPEPERLEERLRSRMTRSAQRLGAPEGRLVESFLKVDVS